MRQGFSDRDRGRVMRRGLLVLLAALLLPLAGMLEAPREGAAQSAPQDSLWTYGASYNGVTGVWSGTVGACASPAESLATCLGAPSSTVEGFYPGGTAGSTVATDGENVYFLGVAGALSCPVADLGTNCTWIMAGPWDTNRGNASIAAYDGEIWIGQTNGYIYRCPADLPYAAQSTAPAECTLLDDAGNRGVESLLLANGTLYAGLAQSSGSASGGVIWSCDPQTPNSCTNLDWPGKTVPGSLAAAGGYLWVGLYNGVVWRCDPDTANACTNWDRAGDGVASISYDGQGTLYAAVQGVDGVIWSCPIAAANSCSNVLSGVYGVSVAAGAGGVFSSSLQEVGFSFDTSPLTAANSGDHFSGSPLLYVPAEGPAGVGAAAVGVTSGTPADDPVGQQCARGGSHGKAKARVTVLGPHGFERTQKVRLCRLLTTPVALDLLDPGDYVATVRTKAGSGEARFTVEPDRTRQVSVRLEPAT